ncbi:hypothetical protein ACP4OV_014530 [Aristida adscensionis]
MERRALGAIVAEHESLWREVQRLSEGNAGDVQRRLADFNRRLAGLDRQVHELTAMLGGSLHIPRRRRRRASTVTPFVDGEAAYPRGGFGGVPASAAAVASLERQEFRAGDGGRGIVGCVICVEDFEDGEEVSVMPCSSTHRFHGDCIAQWLGRSNVCPLCRHALPTAVDD